MKLAESFGMRRLPLRDRRTRSTRAITGGAVECGGPCVIDARVDHEEKVYPMVPAGAPSADMIDVEWAEDDNAWVEEGV